MGRTFQRRPEGRVRVRRNGTLIFERSNVVVNAGLPAFAKLAGGATVGQSVSVVGYGSGGVTPTVNDTDLSLAPKYYNSVGAATYPSPGTVMFSFGLTGSDYAAYNMTVQEIGIYANSSGTVIPAVAGFSYPAWAAASAQPVGNLVHDASGRPFRSSAPPAWAAVSAVVAGQLVTDSNGNLQQCTQGGTTGATSPLWSATVGNTAADGSAIWTCSGLGGYTPMTGGNQPIWNIGAVGEFTWDNSVAWQFLAALTGPGPMIAHAVVPAFQFSGTANYSGTWSLTF
jgi:hypothetical protein